MVPINRPPSLYRVRYLSMAHGGIATMEVDAWAFSAEDAKFQVELQLKIYESGHRPHIMYVGPVNPSCQCINECRCGSPNPKPVKP